MADYITLLGVEQVSNASRRMNEAADEMQRAASCMDEVFRRHQLFMDQWLQEFSVLLEQKK